MLSLLGQGVLNIVLEQAFVLPVSDRKSMHKATGCSKKAGTPHIVLDSRNMQCAGQDSLMSQQAGRAVAYLGKAKSQLAGAQSASKAYDRAQPVTSATDHEYADLELRQTVKRPHERVQS